MATLLLWVYVTVETLRACVNGQIFDALPAEEEIGWDKIDGALPAEKT